MLTVFCSPGRSPGASTAALATALSWPGDVILAECDPAGGTALTGLCMSLLPQHGLIQWALATGRGADPALELEQQLLPLDDRSAHLLALPPGPAPIKTLRPHWELLTATLRSSGADVITDIGRIGGTETPVPFLAIADHVLLVTRPAYPDQAAASAALRYLAGIRGNDGARILLTGSGPYPAAVIARDLPAQTVTTFPRDPRTAARLNCGIRPPRSARPLMKAAAALAASLTQAVSTPIEPEGARP